MKTIAQILAVKGNQTWQVLPTSPVYDALKLMADKDIGAVLVMDGARLLGIFSERDYARKVILRGKSSRQLPVGEVMSAPPIFIEPQETVEQALAIMSAKHVRHLPVMQAGSVVGIVTIGDLVQSLIDEQKVLIKNLEHHILTNTSLT
jgi:CBS domain-containing protein